MFFWGEVARAEGGSEGSGSGIRMHDVKKKKKEMHENDLECLGLKSGGEGELIWLFFASFR